MDFKHIKKGKIILFTGEGVLIFSLVPVLAGLFLYLLDYGFGLPLFLAGIFIFVASFLLWLTGVKIYFTEYKVYNIKEVYQNAKKYAPIPYCEITNYKGEIEKLRTNYAATNDKNCNLNVSKMRKFVADSKNGERLLDLNVFNTGNICYSYVISAHVTLFTPSCMNKYGTLFVVYSTDSYFDEHPEELKNIGGKIKDDEWYFVSGGEFVFNKKLPLDMTDGREVLLTTIIVKRSNLPMGYLTGDILPIIALPNSSAFVVDSSCWTENLVGSFAFKNDIKKRGAYNAQKIALYEEKECGDYAKELEYIRGNYIADPDNEPYDFMGENPFPAFTHTSTTVYYAYAMLLREKANKPDYSRTEVPAVVIYSTEDYFKSNPYIYTKIAKNIRDNEKIYNAIKNIVNFKEHSISPMVVPKTYTDGYNVIMTALFVNKLSLPTCRIASAVIPVICNQEEGGWISAADCKYWSKGFTYEFANGKFEIQM